MGGNKTSFFIPPNEIQLSTHQIESARSVFELLDVENTGKVPKEGLIGAFSKFGMKLTASELDTYFQQYDIDVTHGLNFNKYLKIIQYQFAEICIILSENEAIQAEFSAEEFKIILEFITIKSYKKEEKLQQTGEPSRAVCIVLHGEIEMTCEHGTDELTRAGASHMFGLSALTEEGSQTYCVTAMSDVVLAIFDIENLEMLMLRDPNLYRRLKKSFNIGPDEETAPPIKYVAVIAHNNVKQVMVSFIEKHFEFFNSVPIVGTLSTGSILFQKLGISLVKKVASGPLGGDQAIGALIAPGNLSAIFFFRDPLTAHPHQADIDALCRLCDVHQIPFATNSSTAEALAIYLKDNGLDQRADSHARGVMNQYITSQTDALKKL